MNGSPMPWVKFYTRAIDDPRFNLLSDSAKWRYIQITLLAGRLDAGGSLILEGSQLTDEQIAHTLRISTKVWLSDSKILIEASYLRMNGNGYELPRFMDEQGPSQEDKRAAWRDRQQRHREKSDSVTGDNSVTNPTVTALESESESESESEKKKRSASSSAASHDAAELEIILIIGKAAGIINRHITLLKKTPGITGSDTWAMLAWCYSRGDLRRPGFIAFENLLSGERASSDWYSPDRWNEYIPEPIRQKGGLIIRGEEVGGSQQKEVATRIYSISNNVTDLKAVTAWETAYTQLAEEVSIANCKAYLVTAKLLTCENNIFTVGVPTSEARDWLEDRVSKTLVRLLTGICNHEILVKFVIIDNHTKGEIIS